MAFPSVRSTANTNGTVADATATLNLPGTIRAGDTIFVIFRCAVAGAVSWPDSSWVEMFDASVDAADDQFAAAWRKADGTEGANITLVANGNGKFAAIAWAVQDATDPTIRAPELSTAATGTLGAEPDATTVTPTGGAKDYLWITFFSMEGEQTGITTYPANFTLNQTGLANSGTGGAVTTNVTAAGAARQQNAASQDAGIWDVAGTIDDWTAYTIAFHPAEEVPSPLQTEYPQPNPLPRRSSIELLTSVSVGLLLTTLGTPPVVESPPVTGQTTLLISREAPRVYDQPNLLLSTLLESAPAPTVEWPVPEHRQSSIERLGWMFSSPLVLMGQDQVYGDPGQAPTYEDQPVPQARLSSVDNLTWTWSAPNQTLLAPAPETLPFALADWPVPVRKVGTLLITTSSVPGTSAAVAAEPPFAQLDWLLPTAKKYPSALRTWIDQRELFLEDLVPAHLTEWPVPDRRRSGIHLLPQTLNLLHSTLTPVVVERPFVQSEWPLPQRQKRQGQRLSFISYYALDDTLPFVQQAQPLVPRGRGYPVGLRSWSQNLLQSTLFVPPPTPPPGRLQDWPVPDARGRHLDLRTWLQGRKLHYLDFVPAHLTEWPIPTSRRRQAELITWSQNLLESTFTIIPPVMPEGRLQDWPVPRGRAYPLVLRASLDTRKAFHVDLTPAALRDWPVPTARRSQRDLRVVQWDLNEKLVIATIPPGRLQDWPIAVSKGYHLLLRTGLDTRKAYHQDLVPAHLTEWPIPEGRVPALGLMTWTTGELIVLPRFFPPDIDIIGSYVPVIEIVGSYVPVIEIVGEYDEET